MDVRRRGNNRVTGHGSMTDIRIPRPVLTPKLDQNTADSPTPITVDLPKIDEPKTVAPLVLAIAEELTDTADSTNPKKARFSRSTKITTRTVEIRLAYPTLPTHPAVTSIKNKVSALPRKKLVTGGVLFAVALIAFSGYYLIGNRQASVAADDRPTRSPSELLRGTPDYPTRLPHGKTIDDLGGWTLVSPPDRNPVYAYVDHIDDIQINVSQQPLPEDFLADTEEQIELLARGYKASEKITVGDTIVHIGTSALGPQSVIFYKDNLLILIKSTVKVSSDKWAEYINSLL
ncbi:MAG: hypothetical protein JWM07_415 [Candidatus Saccharibacteria bacterium]|nr:hypothetical protein [Candidatus Saccharibacteria bacterium]